MPSRVRVVYWPRIWRGQSALAGCLVSVGLSLTAPRQGWAQSEEVEAQASEPAVPFELVWNAPPTCAERERVLDEVTRLLPADAAPPAELKVVAEVVQSGETGWSIQLRFEGSIQGERDFESVSCDSLAKAAAVIIALAINEEQAAPPEPEPEPEPEPKPEPKPEPEPEPEPEPRPALELGLGAEGQAGLLPWVVGPMATLAVHEQALRGALGFGWSPQQNERPGSVDLSADLGLWWLGVSGCAGFIDPSLEVFGCLQYRLASFSARGHGTGVVAQDNSELLHVVAPGVLARAPLATGVALQLGADALLPLVRPRVLIASDPAGTNYEVFAASAVGLSAHAELSFAVGGL